MPPEPPETVDEHVIHDGPRFVVRGGTFRHGDGSETEREWVEAPNAVAIVAYDDEQLYLVRQPREPTGEPDLLELPAGKLDEEGEEPLATAKRELAEEIGKAAEHWEELTSFFTSPGFTDEQVDLWRATGLSDAQADAEEDERIEIVAWPLTDLEDAIAETRDSKTIIGLLLLERRLRAG